jgi:hypothetical protein
VLGAVAVEERGECWWLAPVHGAPVRGDRGGGALLLLELRLTRPLGRVVRALRASRLIDAADVLLARNRARLGRLVPDRPGPRRYP